jgi:HPt (histidine-containing phosphotransfer) domain-containing protein
MEVISKLDTYNNQDNPKTQVRVDADLEDIIPGYLANRYKDIALILEALAVSNFEKIRIAGHSMKGSGGGYGFDAITEFGGALELGAQNRNSDDIQGAVNNLQRYLDHVEVIYEECN